MKARQGVVGALRTAYLLLVGLFGGGCDSSVDDGLPETYQIASPLSPLSPMHALDMAERYRRLDALPTRELIYAHSWSLASSSDLSIGNFGLARVPGGAWRRLVKLNAAAQLAYFSAPALPQVDCIAIISVDRPHARRALIYDTLLSLFAQAPAQVSVNVLLGNGEAAYLSPSALLAAGLSAEQVDRVHVHRVAPEVDRFLAEGLQHSHQNVPTSLKERRLAWNYARTLLSYQGRRGMLLLEDDVVWAKHAFAQLDQALQARPPQAVTLFNIEQQASPPTPPPADSPPLPLPLPVEVDEALIYRGAVQLMPHPLHGHNFHSTQGMYYAAAITQGLGQFLYLGMGAMANDRLVGEYLWRKHIPLSRTYPSLLQHTGEQSLSSVQTSWFPWSSCFFYELSPAAAACDPNAMGPADVDTP